MSVAPDHRCGRDGATRRAGGLRVETLGCRLNAYESEVIAAHATAAGLDDAIVVNTCAVTGEAARQAAQSIRRLRRDSPAARILVTGCAAQTEPARFAAMPEVDHVIGNAEKMRAETYRALAVGEAPRVAVADIMQETARRHTVIAGFGRSHARVRAGAERLRSSLHLLHHPVRPRALALGAGRRGGGGGAPARRGGDTRSGADRRRSHLLRPDLPGAPTPRHSSSRRSCATCLSCRGCACPRSIRWRRTRRCSMRSRDEERLMPHLHLSLQAGDDLVLKRMKRRHLRADAIDSAAGADDCAQTSRSGPTSSPASRPRPRRCSPARSISSPSAG